MSNRILFARLEDAFKPGRHLLAVGQPRSGKTSLLLYFTAVFHKLGEYVIVRDIGEYYEWFSMLEHDYKILGFVPKDCKILFKHPNFEQAEFDVTDLFTLFDQFENRRINLVFFESFSIELKNHVRFWSDFFRVLLPWKEQPGNGEKKFCMIMDEFGDIAPGKGRTYIHGQNILSQLIAVNHRKFRRHNIRLVAAVHYFRDVTPPIRERFDCYAIKTNYPNPKEVPAVLENYTQKFPKLAVDEMIFVDSSKGFNQFTINEEIKPKRFYNISVQGIQHADELMQKARPETRAEKYSEIWKKRAVYGAAKRIKSGEATVGMIAAEWEVTVDDVYERLHELGIRLTNG